MAKKGKKDKAPPAAAEPVEEEPSEPGPEPEETEPEEAAHVPWQPVHYDPCVTSPVTFGYEPCSSGTVAWDPCVVSPVMAGQPWGRRPLQLPTDPRDVHPAWRGYWQPPGGAADVDFDPAVTSPVFAGKAHARIPDPQPEPQLSHRTFLPVTAVSNEGLYLEEKVWPVLRPALEKLFLALRKHVPQAVRQQYEDPSMKRVLHPEDAAGFDPVAWLGTYLKQYNPNAPTKYTEEEAAVKIQSAARGYKDRQHVRDRRQQMAKDEALRLESQRRNRAATAIQAAFRGHSLRVSLALGQSDLVLGRGR